MQAKRNGSAVLTPVGANEERSLEAARASNCHTCVQVRRKEVNSNQAIGFLRMCENFDAPHSSQKKMTGVPWNEKRSKVSQKIRTD